MNYIKVIIKQLLCLHKVKEVVEVNNKEKYIEYDCINCGKIIFQDNSKKKSLIEIIT